jgi:membrane associated rhomboid family serine protease
MSRIHQLAQSLPPTTRWILIALCLIYGLFQQILFPLLFSSSTITSSLTLSPSHVILRGQVWLLWTSSFLHGSIIHLAMNVMSWIGLASRLESQTMGTLPLMVTVLVSACILTPVLHVLMATIAYYGLGISTWFYEHSLGFSGVLFHITVLEVAWNNAAHQQRSVLGLVSVPPMWYPWVLLIVLQFMVPQISFLGHLSGILAGYIQLLSPYHDPATLASSPCLERTLTWISRMEGRSIIPPPNHDFRTSSLPQLSLRQMCSTIFRYGGYLWEAVVVIFCGQSTSSSLIRTDDGTITTSLTLHEDQDWNGLPPIQDIDNQTVESEYV